MNEDLYEILACPTCGAAASLSMQSPSKARCSACGGTYRIVDGMLDLAPPKSRGDRHYRIETLYDRIAPWYDIAAPLMAMAIWNCPPLRYVDWAHRALGRAEGGRLLVHPIGTGLVLSRVFDPRFDISYVLIDRSWKMLKRARRRLRGAGVDRISLLRADPAHLPFRDGVFDAVLSLNGINGFRDRTEAISEIGRVMTDEGTLVGSALCRGLERVADRLLNRYESWGIYPILRSRDFLMRELSDLLDAKVRYETHGAAAFFLATGSQGPTHEQAEGV